jgi:hypothetical protein
LIRYYQRSLAILQSSYGGTNHPEIALGLSSLAWVYYKVRYVFAITHGTRHTQHTRHTTYSKLRINDRPVRVSVEQRGKYNRAHLLYKQSYKMRIAAMGPEHPLVARSLHEIAELYQRVRETPVVGPNSFKLPHTHHTAPH